jgi:hypothetical protein
MAVIDSKRFVSLRLQPLLTDAATTSLFLIHFPVLIIRYAKGSFSASNDPTGFACGIESSSFTVLFIELVFLFDFFAHGTGFSWKSLPSSLYTFVRTATSWLGIALRQGFPEFGRYL